MTLAENKALARVVVIAPRTRVDLALPIDVPIADLLPMLLELVGERSDDGGSQHGGWQLSLIGAGELASDRTLRSLEILDGSALHLRPRESAVAPPIYDDTVDAIAATVRGGMSLRSSNPAVGAATVAVGLAVAAATVLYRGKTTTNASIAVVVALAALLLGAAAARGPGARVIGSVTAAAGLPFAFVAGLFLVPGALGRSGILLGFALALLYAVLAPLALGTGSVVFVSAATATFLATGATLVSAAFDVRPLYTVAGVCAVSVAALTTLPWLVVRVARLPLPLIPTSAEDVRGDDQRIDIGELAARARLADEFLNGAVIGCAAVVTFSCAVCALHASALSVLLAACCVSVLLLRTRSLVGLVPRVAIFSTALGGMLVAGGVAVTGDPHRFATPWLLGAALVLAVGGLFVSVALPRIRVSPVSIRLVGFLEAVLLVAVLPLAVGVMNLYSTMRHL